LNACSVEVVSSDDLVKTLFRKKNKYFARKLRAFRRNSIWISYQREKLAKKYPDYYVAIRKQRIIAKDKKLSSVISKVREIKNNEDVVIDFIGKKRHKFIL